MHIYRWTLYREPTNHVHAVYTSAKLSFSVEKALYFHLLTWRPDRQSHMQGTSHIRNYVHSLAYTHSVSWLCELNEMYHIKKLYGTFF